MPQELQPAWEIQLLTLELAINTYLYRSRLLRDAQNGKAATSMELRSLSEQALSALDEVIAALATIVGTECIGALIALAKWPHALEPALPSGWIDLSKPPVKDLDYLHDDV